MLTEQQYERAADRVANKIRQSLELEEKERLMQGLGNLRYAQYKTTGNMNAKRLAANCFLASRSFHYKRN